MQVLNNYNGSDYWDFDTMKKYNFTDENAFAKIKINNIVIQTTLNNKFIDNASPDILECLKSGLSIKFAKKYCCRVGRPPIHITQEEKAEARKSDRKKYYSTHKMIKINSLPAS